MKTLLRFSILIPCLLPVYAGEAEPVADFRIHTLVSSEPRTFEGDRLRAVVEYGELGFPSVLIESIRVEMGFPPSSKVLWRATIDETGGIGGLCRPPGAYACSLDNLEWNDSTLVYDLKTPAAAYRCSVRVSEGPAIATDCSRAVPPVCWPISFAGITPGVTTDPQVRRLLGDGVSRKEADAVSRSYVDAAGSATLRVKSCTDGIVCEVVLEEGTAVDPSDMRAAASPWFCPSEGFGAWHALHLGSTREEVKENLGEPADGSAPDAWRFDSACVCELPVFFTVYFKNGRIHTVVFSAPQG